MLLYTNEPVFRNSLPSTDLSPVRFLRKILVRPTTVLDRGPTVVKEERYEAACRMFKDTGINITKEGHRHLGAAVGTEEFKCKYVSDKVHE